MNGTQTVDLTAERIRDKIAVSKQRGLWMGATVPLGYAADGRSLRIAEPGKRWRAIQLRADHYILTNPVYAGRIRHHAKV